VVNSWWLALKSIKFRNKSNYHKEEMKYNFEGKEKKLKMEIDFEQRIHDY
jgi:hypothetical protein